MGEPDFIRRFLDLSTAHLAPSTRNLLDSLAGDPAASFTVGDTGFGWIVGVISDYDADYPVELIACFQLAQSFDVPYILFDRDASEIDQLPSYDDDGTLEPAISDAAAEALARAAGWERGGDGDIWWHSSHGSWKHAASWGRTYATAREVIESDDFPTYECTEG